MPSSPRSPPSRRANSITKPTLISSATLTACPAAEIRVIEAADFVTGGEADFARAANARGIVVSSWHAGEGEARAEFLARAKHGAKALGAARLVIGGIPELADRPAIPSAIRPAPRGAIAVPDGALHSGQIDALRVIQANRFAALRAGRRFGKTSLAAALAADTAMLGGMAGLFAPIYKLAAPLFDILGRALAPLLATSNRSIGELRLEGGGGVDIWNLKHSAWAGRGRSYNRVIIDEAAFAGPHLIAAWSAQIRPTMADVQGSAIVASTPAGLAEDNFFWRVCHELSYGFAQFVAPTLRNPFIPPAEIEALRAQHNALVFSQEFEAQFVNLAGVGLFNVEAMLNKGEPWPTPELFDTVFATLDSGVRGGHPPREPIPLFGGNVMSRGKNLSSTPPSATIIVLLRFPATSSVRPRYHCAMALSF
jgi:hypothetical protein